MTVTILRVIGIIWAVGYLWDIFDGGNPEDTELIVAVLFMIWADVLDR